MTGVTPLVIRVKYFTQIRAGKNTFRRIGLLCNRGPGGTIHAFAGPLHRTNVRARVLSHNLGTLQVCPIPTSMHQLVCEMGRTRKISVAHVFYNLGRIHGVVPSVGCTGRTKVVPRTALYVACSPMRAISCCSCVTSRLVRTKTPRVYLGSVTNVNHPRVLKRLIEGVGSGRPRIVMRCRKRSNPKLSVTSVLRIYRGNTSVVSITVRPLS